MILKKRPFLPNSIALREISSMCIGKYKESQAFALSELVSNPTHNFSTTAREILLLKYDIWFRWLVEVEDVLRRRGPNDDIPGIIMTISDELEQEYTEIIIGNPNTFVRTFVDVWLEVHKHMYEYLRTKIKRLTPLDLARFMVEVTDVLILVMDNTLFELHEIDTLCSGGDLFISFDDIYIDYRDIMKNDSCLLSDRLRIYQKHFHIMDPWVTIKDYSKNHTMINDLEQAKIVYQAISKTGFQVKAIV